MIELKRVLTLTILLIIFFVTISFCQDSPVGYWESHLPYSSALGVATDGTTLYAICEEGFFTYNSDNGNFETYSKVNGMSDQGMQKIAYDRATETAVLVYSNGNIDLFKNNTFYNIADLKIKTVAGDKTVYDAYTENGQAYLSTSLGIVVLGLSTHNVNETYQLTIKNQLTAVTGFVGSGEYFYATTPKGLYRTLKNNPEIQDFQVWQKLDSTHNFISITSVGSQIFLCTPNSLYVLKNDTPSIVYTSLVNIKSINAGKGMVFVNEYQSYYGFLHVIDTFYRVIDSINTVDIPTQALQVNNGNIWIARHYYGLAQLNLTTNNLDPHYPDGPAGTECYDIYAYNKNVLVSHGGYTDLSIGTNNQQGFSSLNGGQWSHFGRGSRYPALDSMRDFVTVVKDEKDGSVFAGSFEDGIFQIAPDKSATVYKQGSALDHSVPNGANDFPVFNMAFDANRNLWVTEFGAYHELYALDRSSNTWHKFHFSYNSTYSNSGGKLTFDKAGHPWFASIYGGVIGFDYNNTLSDTSDDQYYHMTNGTNYGNLPSGSANCIVDDQNDNLWIGTQNGIGILYNASSQIHDKQDAEIPIVQYDKFANYLFIGENVNSIAVDGGNRKWVGTDNGVWLLSPDAGNSKIIYRFTIDNSPLPSNKIEKITIDPVTGDVYIGTDHGLISYRSGATDNGSVSSTAITFPDPVPSNYKGTISIKGLPANSDVRITDINGQLVYKTTALGGQAIWDGYDYKGHRPQSGVYLVFSSTSDGGQVLAGKMVFIQ